MRAVKSIQSKGRWPADYLKQVVADDVGSRRSSLPSSPHSSAFFLWFTDFLIYLVHRIEHWPIFYKHVHKPHHKWVIPTPWASHAFHPLDGYLQSLPYHVFVYMFPLHRYTYLGLFVFVNIWTIAIHDSDMITGHPLEHIINGPAHHTLHHMYFVYNYGQYFTWADKAGGSYRHPKAADDPLNAVLRLEEAKELLRKEKAQLAAQEEQEAAAATPPPSSKPAASTIRHSQPSLSPATAPSTRSSPSSLRLSRTDSERSYSEASETDNESLRTGSSVSEVHTPSDERSEDGHGGHHHHLPSVCEGDDEIFRRAFAANRKTNTTLTTAPTTTMTMTPTGKATSAVTTTTTPRQRRGMAA